MEKIQLNEKSNARRYITIWLITACVMILSMVVIGGITRLTQSGLSMVEWKPVTGVIPPMSQEAWEKEFDLYKEFPQYQKVNYHMTLEEFKFIYFWEYFHRLIGRVLGLVFIVPFIFFYRKNWLSPPLLKKLMIMFFLGLSQGLMGWYMVASGLVDRPHVSHYRLAIHFLFAVVLVGYIFWTLLDYRNRDRSRETDSPACFSRGINLFIGLVLLQMIYGAFTAGLKAGYGWNTFPLMNGEWIPAGLFSLTPWWYNLVEHNMTVQFIHRILGYIIVLLGTTLWWKSRSFTLNHDQKRSTNLLLGMVWIQVILGILTLIFVVPVSLGVIHQIGAVALFLIALNLRWYLNRGAACTG